MFFIEPCCNCFSVFVVLPLNYTSLNLYNEQEVKFAVNFEIYLKNSRFSCSFFSGFHENYTHSTLWISTDKLKYTCWLI